MEAALPSDNRARSKSTFRYLRRMPGAHAAFATRFAKKLKKPSFAMGKRCLARTGPRSSQPRCQTIN
jgi:hypothetical protein